MTLAIAPAPPPSRALETTSSPAPRAVAEGASLTKLCLAAVTPPSMVLVGRIARRGWEAPPSLKTPVWPHPLLLRDRAAGQ